MMVGGFQSKALQVLNIRGGNGSLSGLLLLWQQAAHRHHSGPH